MDIVLRVAFLYVVVLITLRLTTRKVMRTSTPLDMVVIFLVGGMAVQAAMAGDQSVTGVLIGIGSVTATHMLIATAKLHWRLAGNIAEGSPVVVFGNGKWAREEMTWLNIQEQDVLAEVRQNGHRNLEDVELVVSEHNGALTVIAKPKPSA